jgi:hypothetical protein
VGVREQAGALTQLEDKTQGVQHSYQEPMTRYILRHHQQIITKEIHNAPLSYSENLNCT